MLAPEVETRPWAEQLAVDDASYGAQLAYLFDRSAFYREKLTSAGFASDRAAGGLADIAQLPLTEQGRDQGNVHARQSDRRASLRDAIRDRPDLLDERHHRHAQLHPADRGRPRQLGDRLGAQLRRLGRRRRPAHRLHLQRRAVRGGRGACRLRAHRPLSHSGRHREHRASDAGDRAPAARGRGAHALLCRLSRRMGGGAGRRPARRRASSACSSRASPAVASRPSEPSSKRAGAQRSPRRWASATSASRSGASARSRTECTWARAASSTPS